MQVQAVDAAGNRSAPQTRTVEVAQPQGQKPADDTSTVQAPSSSPVTIPAPTTSGQAPVRPAPVAVPPSPASLAQSLLGSPVKALSDIVLGNVRAFAAGPVRRGSLTVPANASAVPVLALVATSDTRVKAVMGLEVPARTAVASVAALRKVKLPTQRLTLKAGEAGVVKLRLNAAQRKLIAAGRARLVRALTDRGATGNVTRDSKRLKLKAAKGKSG